MRREYVYDVLEAFALSTGIFHPSIIGISADDVKSQNAQGAPKLEESLCPQMDAGQDAPCTTPQHLVNPNQNRRPRQTAAEILYFQPGFHSRPFVVSSHMSSHIGHRFHFQILDAPYEHPLVLPQFAQR
jgi:hypothetical protein